MEECVENDVERSAPPPGGHGEEHARGSQPMVHSDSPGACQPANGGLAGGRASGNPRQREVATVYCC